MTKFYNKNILNIYNHFKFIFYLIYLNILINFQEQIKVFKLHPKLCFLHKINFISLDFKNIIVLN